MKLLAATCPDDRKVLFRVTSFVVLIVRVVLDDEFEEIMLSHMRYRICGPRRGGIEARFEDVDLSDRNFRRLDLTRVDFIRCNLDRADFTDAVLDFASFHGCDLRTTVGIRACSFDRSMTIGHKTKLPTILKRAYARRRAALRNLQYG